MKDFFKKLGTVVATIFVTIFGVLIFNKRNCNNKPNEIKEEIKNEIEQKDASDVVDDSDKRDVIRTGIEQEQEEFRKRVRNRLNENL